MPDNVWVWFGRHPESGNEVVLEFQPQPDGLMRVSVVDPSDDHATSTAREVAVIPFEGLVALHRALGHIVRSRMGLRPVGDLVNELLAGADEDEEASA